MHILGLGAIAVDDLLLLDAHPQPDSKQQVKSRMRVGGGLCATALIAAQRLGVQTAFAGVLGEDELSRFSLDELQREGVNTSRVIIRDGARPRYAVILVDNSNGKRCVLSSRDGVAALRAEEFRPEWLDDCACLFVDHTEAEVGVVAAQEAQKRGIPVVGDIERADERAITDFVGYVDHLIFNLDFARCYARSSGMGSTIVRPFSVVRAWRDNLCPNAHLICVTDGANGCYFGFDAGFDPYSNYHNFKFQHLPAFPVQTVDTTGCGDAFHGAYAASLVQGFSIRDCLVRASACAALNATGHGGRHALPTRAQLEAFLVANAPNEPRASATG